MRDYGNYRMLMNKYNHLSKYMRKVRNWMDVYQNKEIAIDSGWGDIVEIEQYYTTLEMRKISHDLAELDPQGVLRRKYEGDNNGSR